MNTKVKTDKSFLIGILVSISAILLFLSLPLVSYAQTGTLGQESPEIYCTYEQDGVPVDGNNLSAGSYNVNFVLSGVSSLSLIEVTATYDAEQVTIESTPVSLISDDATSGFDSMGYILSDGNIVFGFVSTDAACTPLTEEKQIIATVKMTFASDCDVADYISISQNPNLTFAQVDYGDGYDDSYAMVDTFEGYNGSLYLMTGDITPSFGFDVKGELVVMTDPYGTTYGKTVNGEYTIKVYDKANRNNLITTITSNTVIVDGKTVNQFEIPNLINGTFILEISSPYSIMRDDITLIINNNDIKNCQIPVIACDYDGNGFINVNDAANISVETGNVTDNLIYDLDGDGYANVSDVAIVQVCASESPNYPAITIS